MPAVETSAVGPSVGPGRPVSPETSPTAPRPLRVLRRLCWLYVAGLTGLWLLLFIGADRWWLPTLVMFGPRWVWGVPLPVLVLLALIRRARAALPLLLAALILVGPIARFCVPWRRAFQPAGAAAAAMRLRVVTCNADGSDLDAKAMRALLDDVRPDVVVFQAWVSRHERTLFDRARGPGDWQVRRDGELFLASRHPVLDTRLLEDAPFTAHPGTMARYELQTPGGRVWLYNVHLATPREGLLSIIRMERDAPEAIRQNVDARRAQSRSAARWIESAPGPAVVAGDFNTPTDSTVYRESWSSYLNAFTVAGFGLGRTHLTRNTSVRIDHVLTGPGWRVRACRVGPYVGSAHRPVIADLEWTASAGQ